MTKLLGHIENQNTNLDITLSSSDDGTPNSSDITEADIISTTENIVIEVLDVSNNSV